MNRKKLYELPDGSGSLSSDDIFLVMDNPGSSGVSKKISLSQLSDAISLESSNPFDQDLNTKNSPSFIELTISNSKIFGGGTNSGDGNEYGTLELVPDSGLYEGGQYLIIDPTGPNHVHLRAGGNIDDSNAELIIGGEKNNLRINDQTPSVRMQTESLITLNTYYLTSPEFSSATWETVGENHRVVINDPSPTIYEAVWALNTYSLFNVIDAGSNYYELTYSGSSTPGGSSPVMVYVNQAPPSNPTTLTELTFEIRTIRQTSIAADGSDIRIEAADDVRIYSRDIFRLANYSSTDPIQIFTDYDDQEYKWEFTADGKFISPNGATIGSIAEGFPAFYNSNNNSPVFVAAKDIDSGSSVAYIAVSGNSEFGGEVGINVATNGLASNTSWSFTNDGALNFPNSTRVMTGSFDNSTDGNNGISLYCYVGYELNWQGGHLKSTLDNGVTAETIYFDSPIEFSGSGIDNVEINSSGIVFSDGTIQTTAWTGGYLKSDPTGIAGATAISNIVQISQANYDSLPSYDANTIYIIND